jgi:hypothetical protein
VVLRVAIKDEDSCTELRQKPVNSAYTGDIYVKRFTFLLIILEHKDNIASLKKKRGKLAL